ncbi:MAG: hypothetical protein IKP53_08195 [Candidatus Methanomethylophilaceae archaeon]|nr:hypothetical protein [Candidatus Methanomethylophilaceae archaeon]
MITEYTRGTRRSDLDVWYTFTYSNGIRATLSEYRGDVEELEDLGRRLSAEKGREIRMRRHYNGTDRLHAIFQNGRKTTRRERWKPRKM